MSLIAFFLTIDGQNRIHIHNIICVGLNFYLASSQGLAAEVVVGASPVFQVSVSNHSLIFFF